MQWRGRCAGQQRSFEQGTKVKSKSSIYDVTFNALMLRVPVLVLERLRKGFIIRNLFNKAKVCLNIDSQIFLKSILKPIGKQ